MPLSHDLAAPKDFDFIVGHWRVKHRRLKECFVDCQQWIEFEGESSTVKILGGFGNLEDNLLCLPSGEFRAVALRSFCPVATTWSIWWLDGRDPRQFGPPMVGAFSKHRGVFFGDDVVAGRAVRVRFLWTAVPGQPPRWEQAFSLDAGEHWECNWTMEFRPKTS